MKQIDVITSDPYQTFTYIDDDNNKTQFTLRYYPQQMGWFMDVFYEPNGFEVNNIRIVASPNLLSQYSHKIPFGVLIVSDYLQEPMFQESFSGGIFRFYILDKSEVEYIENEFYV